jgi:hypothetical protein
MPHETEVISLNFVIFFLSLCGHDIKIIKKRHDNYDVASSPLIFFFNGSLMDV